MFKLVQNPDARLKYFIKNVIFLYIFKMVQASPEIGFWMSGFQTYGIWHFRVSEIQTCPEYGHFLYFDQNIDRIFIPKNFSVSKARFLHEQKFELKCMQIFFVHKTKLTAMFWYMGTKLPCKFAFFHSVLLILPTSTNFTLSKNFKLVCNMQYFKIVHHLTITKMQHCTVQ